MAMKTESEGWVCLHRKLLDSRVFQNEGLLRVWIWCLLKASHKETWIPVKTGRSITEVHLKPGQFIFGRESAAKELKMNPETIRKRMMKLKNMQNCTIDSTTKYSLVTVVNWEVYQSEENKVPSKVPTKYQPSTTNNNVNNNTSSSKEEECSNSKKVRTHSPQKTFSEDSEAYKLANHHLAQILKLSPNIKKPSLQSWAQDVDYMLRIDGRKPEEIWAVIDWIFTGDEPDALFWRKNILSPGSMRKKKDGIQTFDRLVRQMNQSNPQKERDEHGVKWDY